MNLSISDELQLFSEELQRYMSPYALDQLAKKYNKLPIWTAHLHKIRYRY